MRVKRLLKVGIIGLGVGEKHIEGYNSHSACEVVALCDFSRSKISFAHKRYPDLKVTDNADDILGNREIDVVSIASYDNYHYEQIVKALQNNKHVFVEKPLCLYEREARHIRYLLKEKPDLKLTSNLILRMYPRFLALKKLVDRNRIGTIFYLEGDYNYGRLNKITDGWRGRLDFYSIVYGGGVHIVDLLLWLVGGDVIEVSAYANNIASRGSQFKYNDMVVSILKFNNGVVAKVGVNFGCVFPHFHNISVYGTKATFVNNFKHGLLFESRDSQRNPRKIVTKYPGINKDALIHNFLDSIIYGDKLIVPINDIFKTMSVCFAVEKATQRGSFVKVKYI